VVADVIGHQRDALLGIQIDHTNTERAEPIEPARKIVAFADDQGAETELPN
jgi:hypothetical protein